MNSTDAFISRHQDLNLLELQRALAMLELKNYPARILLSSDGRFVVYHPTRYQVDILPTLPQAIELAIEQREKGK